MRLRAFVAVQCLDDDGLVDEHTFVVDAQLCPGGRVTVTARRRGEGAASVPLDLDAGALRAVLGPLGVDFPAPATEPAP